MLPGGFHPLHFAGGHEASRGELALEQIARVLVALVDVLGMGGETERQTGEPAGSYNFV